MKHYVTIEEIKNKLEECKIPFVVLNNNSSSATDKFRLCSIKHVLPEPGLYYLHQNLQSQLEQVKNSVCLVDFKPDNFGSNLFIEVEDPQLAHSFIAAIFERKHAAGIHPTAIIHPEAIIHPSVHIGPFCQVGICEIKANVVLLGSVVINDNTVIDEYTVIEHHTVIGARGVSWFWDKNNQKVQQPQLGGTYIGPNCVIGTNITIVRGSLSEDTYIGANAGIAHGTMIGHGTAIGADVHISNNVTIAGNASISDKCFLGSGSVISSNIVVPEGCIVGAGACVSRNYKETYLTLVGVPSQIIARENYSKKFNGVPQIRK